MEATVDKTALKGGEFLIKDQEPETVFIPEEWSEEQQMIAQSCEDFLEAEVMPKVAAMDSMKHPEIMPKLLEQAGELGLLGASVPESYGGMGFDTLTVMLITEKLGAGNSFAVGFSAHTGIGTLPTLYFGTEEQKQQYLPKFATGEWKAAYCLTEPGSGSDALGAKSTAVLSDDGKHYILNGQKIWITNGGFADLFTVFAKIDGEKFTGFLVPANAEGVALGDEEHKMGIKGSSTRAVFFSDVKVPVDHVLGEIGKGHKIAFNILNIGRIKLGGAALGAIKKVVKETVQYANEREQFKQPISNFGAIQFKMAEQAIRTFVLESATYRATADIQRKEEENVAAGMSHEQALLNAAEEYAIECAMMKVLGSEVLDYVVDEGVQVYGGNGFSADYPMDRAYRDARINRIFEGTNEINRLLTVDMILKRAMKGKIDLMNHVMKIQGELTSLPSFETPDDSGVLAKEARFVKNFKKAILMVAGAAVQKFMQKLSTEQEIIMNLADMAIWTYACESAMLRVQKMAALKGADAVKEQIAMVETYVYDCAALIDKAGKDAIASFAEGDMVRMLFVGLKRFTKVDPVNVRDNRRMIAAKMIEANDYVY